jgi:6-phosphogluconate dehydrogenase
MSGQGTADVGLIGLAVMGRNLALNIADHGFAIAVYNRTTDVMREFVSSHDHTPGDLMGCETLEGFLGTLKTPRIILLMVRAGSAVDAVVAQLLEAGLQPEDLVVDCGNSCWTDTIRREEAYADMCHFLGSGVSGGEVGARFGPSLMPGGSIDAWTHLEPIWKAIAAKVDTDTGKPIETAKPGQPVEAGEPCTAYIGPNGAGHYVKMVHNGIEYVDMQLIGEAYVLLRQLLDLSPEALSAIFRQWNDGDLESYLIEITADILQQRDPDHPDAYLLDYILDTASHKGTGKWTSLSALDMGVPANAIAEAVFARYLSALKDERLRASEQLAGPDNPYRGDPHALITTVRDALYCAKICAYAQGFQLMRAAQHTYDWTLDFAAIARIWRGGCIIRARFLQKIVDAYTRDPDLGNLLLDPYFNDQIQRGQSRWRSAVGMAAQVGIAVPALMATLAYYDGYRAERLPANLLQAQRDYFGAHTYARTDRPRDAAFHLDWPNPERPQQQIASTSNKAE